MDIWGRPVVTTLHMPTAQLPGTLLGLPLGLVGVRATSMAVAVVAALLAWRVAAGLGQARPGLAALFLLVQPLVILHSISELTELPFALLATLCLLAYQRRWWWLLALAAGLTPAARPEGFGLVLLAGTALAAHRRWELLLLPLPLLAWDRLGWSLHGGPGAWWQITSWLRGNWPYSGQSAYEPGPIWAFVEKLPAATGPSLLPLVLIGTLAALRRRDWRDHHTRVAWATAAVPWGVLAVHSVLYWSGRMASSGDVRYLVAVAPFWALLAAGGFDWLAKTLAAAWPAKRLTAAAVALAVVPLPLFHLAYPVVPLALDDPGRAAVAVTDWYVRSDLPRTHPNLSVDHPITRYRLDLSPTTAGGGAAIVRLARPGSVYLWHDIYSRYNADATLVVPEDMPPRFGWRDETPDPFPAGWRIFTTEPRRTRSPEEANSSSASVPSVTPW